MNTITAETYRTFIKMDMSWDDKSDEEIYERLTNMYRKYVDELNITDIVDEKEINDIKFIRYTLAIGLFAHGHIEVVDHIINYTPPKQRLIYRAKGILRQITPILYSIDVHNDLEGTRAWFDENKSKLIWDSEKERYIFNLSITRSDRF